MFLLDRKHPQPVLLQEEHCQKLPSIPSTTQYGTTMYKFIFKYVALAACSLHSYDHRETSTLKIEASGVEAALLEFWEIWDRDDYMFFKNLNFCPECERISSTSCEIHSIEIIPIENNAHTEKTLTIPIPTESTTAQNKELCDALGVEYQGEYSDYAVYHALLGNNVKDIFIFRVENAGKFVSAVRDVFRNNKAAATALISKMTKEAREKILFTAYSEYITTKSVPTSVKNAQNKSLCEALGVQYHKIFAAKALVAILQEHDIEPRKFRTDNKNSFSEAVLALYNSDKNSARKALQKHMTAASKL